MITDINKGIYPESIGKWKATAMTYRDWGIDIENKSIDFSKCERLDEEVRSFWTKR